MMAEEMLYIDPEKSSKESLNFNELKKDGIGLIEQYCGGIWTDYNGHDPGITILEQLIYALTEISYRTEFEVKDLLTNPKDGTIDERKQVLISADEIMPCSPLITRDYTKLLYDKVLGVANAWFSPIPVEKYGVNGLYKASVFVYDMPQYQSLQDRKRIQQNIIEVLSDHRNLCEDFEEIEILEYVDLFIKADIEITSQNTPETILAEIYFTVSNFIAPEIKLYSYLELKDEGVSIDELFTGPSLQYGFTKDEELKERPLKVYDTQIIDIINNIKGVKSIKNLKLSLNGSDYHKEVRIDDSQVLRFDFDVDDEEAEKRFKFYKGSNTRRIEINAQKTKQEQNVLKASQRRSYRLDEQYKKYLDVPAGRKLNLDEYYSVQNQFPHIYGINQFGVPNSEKPLRKAQAKQLKGYLIVFEQILVNYLAQLSHIKDLFSIRDIEDTYFFKLLDNTIIPHLRGLYVLSEGEEYNEKDIPKGLAKKMRALTDHFDDKLGRRSKFLDYMLSMYGERFHQYSLSRLNYYYTEEQNRENINDNKVRFLEGIHLVNRYRGTAYNYQQPYGENYNISGVEFKVKLLLEINSRVNSLDGCSVLSIFDNNNIRLTSQTESFKHDCYEFDEDSGGVRSAPVNETAVEYAFEGVSFEETEKMTNEEKEELLSQITFINRGVIDDAMLRAAIDEQNYKLGHLKGPDTHVVVLRTIAGDEQVWRRIGVFENYMQAKKAVQALIEHARELNIEGEDFHLVEHILLRNSLNSEELVSKESIQDLHSLYRIHEEQQRDFYSFRMSVVLPNWTARFNDVRFQELAMETFYLNIPAHIAVDYLWLSPEEMCDFEQSYCAWMTKKASDDATQEEIDELAVKVELFLRRYKAKNK
ncbi:MAG: hypothetical protein FH748_15050 [Balneolaceae bacterium]|nr:hypothetical protein [Balneolaceae bacterium]